MNLCMMQLVNILWPNTIYYRKYQRGKSTVTNTSTPWCIEPRIDGDKIIQNCHCSLNEHHKGSHMGHQNLSNGTKKRKGSPYITITTTTLQALMSSFAHYNETSWTIIVYYFTTYCNDLFKKIMNSNSKNLVGINDTKEKTREWEIHEGKIVKQIKQKLSLKLCFTPTKRTYNKKLVHEIFLLVCVCFIQNRMYLQYVCVYI